MKKLVRNDGFTFIEVIVTCALFAMLVSIFVSASSVMHDSNKQIKISDLSREILAFVSDDLKRNSTSYLDQSIQYFNYKGELTARVEEAYYEVTVVLERNDAQSISNRESVIYSSQSYLSFDLPTNKSSFILLLVDEPMIEGTTNTIRVYERKAPSDKISHLENQINESAPVMGFKYEESQSDLYECVADWIKDNSTIVEVKISSKYYLKGTKNSVPFKINNLMDFNKDIKMEVWNYSSDALQLYQEDDFDHSIQMMVKAGKISKAEFSQMNFQSSHINASISLRTMDDAYKEKRDVNIYFDLNGSGGQ